MGHDVSPSRVSSPRSRARASSHANEVGTGFFATLDIPLLRGRDFTDADTLGAPQVAIVNESFAKRFGLGDNPIGKRIGVR